MSLIYNGTTITKLIYNGTECNKASYNGASIFSTIDPTKTSYTETEFIAVVSAGLQNQLSVGTSISLTNTHTRGGSWKVIGVDHQDIYGDSSSIAYGTVDLYCDGYISSCFFSNNSTKSYQYAESQLRTTVTNDMPNSFNKVKDLLKTMIVVSNKGETTTEDKAKVLSFTEIGAKGSIWTTNEGTKYEAFASHSGATYGFSDVFRGYNTKSIMWLRSVYSTTSNMFAGSVKGSYYSYDISDELQYNQYYWCPVVRF